MREKQRRFRIMALINCPECGREISDTVKQCPNCGFILKVKKKRSKMSKIIASVISVC